MTEPNGMIYLCAGGAERFRKDTSKRFRKRDNATLLEIDGKLNAYPIIPTQNFNQRAQALVAIITLCVKWLDAKKTKIDGHGSFRAPVIQALGVRQRRPFEGSKKTRSVPKRKLRLKKTGPSLAMASASCSRRGRPKGQMAGPCNPCTLITISKFSIRNTAAVKN